MRPYGTISYIELVILLSLDPLLNIIKKAPTLFSFITFTNAFWVVQVCIATLVTSYEQREIKLSQDHLELLAIFSALVS